MVVDSIVNDFCESEVELLFTAILKLVEVVSFSSETRVLGVVTMDVLRTVVENVAIFLVVLKVSWLEVEKIDDLVEERRGVEEMLIAVDVS